MISRPDYFPAPMIEAKAMKITGRLGVETYSDSLEVELDAGEETRGDAGE